MSNINLDSQKVSVPNTAVSNTLNSESYLSKIVDFLTWLISAPFSYFFPKSSPSPIVEREVKKVDLPPRQEQVEEKEIQVKEAKAFK